MPTAIPMAMPTPILPMRAPRPTPAPTPIAMPTPRYLFAPMQCSRRRVVQRYAQWICGADGTRTRDPLLAKQVLSPSELQPQRVEGLRGYRSVCRATESEIQAAAQLQSVSFEAVSLPFEFIVDGPPVSQQTKKASRLAGKGQPGDLGAMEFSWRHRGRCCGRDQLLLLRSMGGSARFARCRQRAETDSGRAQGPCVHR